MNIVFLHSSSDLYGASKILLITINTLIKRGHNCLVILPESGDLIEKLNDINVETIIFDLGVIRRKYFNVFGIINRLYYFIKAIVKIVKIIKSDNINIIYTNTTAIFSGIWAAKICSKKHLWHIHEIIESPKIVSKLISWHINKFDGINIVVSNPVKDFWCNNQKIKRSKINVIHNGINPLQLVNINPNYLKDELKLSKGNILIGMIGRIHYWKGQEYFLDLAFEAKKINHKCKFIIVGNVFSGYEYLYDILKQKVIELELVDDVFFLGYRADIIKILLGLDIFILPSIKPDPFPTVILEAMSCSLPVIGTSHGGVPEMIEDGKTGYLIPWNDAIYSINKVSDILFDKEKRIKMGRKGLKRLNKNFSLNNYETNISNVIDTIK